MSEAFIGGFCGGFMGRGFMGLRAGYGLYFTSTRLFGVYAAKWTGGSLAGPTGGLIKGELMPSLTPAENTSVIGELELARDYELAKDQVRSIELRKTGPLMLWTGGATIRPVQGSAIRYVLRSPIAYDRLVLLTQAFSPESVRR
ncbi:MAG TPA: hypothetical protein VFL29_02045 [Candidatus Dormibacteraeota bacterium]|nr:hypothetical protein [Candidatus Dormibacteraeota bacterium]